MRSLLAVGLIAEFGVAVAVPGLGNRGLIAGRGERVHRHTGNVTEQVEHGTNLGVHVTGTEHPAKRVLGIGAELILLEDVAKQFACVEALSTRRAKVLVQLAA